MRGRPKKDRTLDKYWIFLDVSEAEAVRVRADELGVSFSAYVRRIIQNDIESDRPMAHDITSDSPAYSTERGNRSAV